MRTVSSLGSSAPRLLFVVTEDWYFVSHRLALARAACAEGFRVSVATRIRDHGDEIRSAGVETHDIDFRRAATNPLIDLRVLARLRALYRRLEPALVHNVALKPVILGSLAARMTGSPAVVNALGGLGYVFASRSRRAAVLRPLVARSLKIALGFPRSRLILQNEDDCRLLTSRGLIDPTRIRMVRGVGVNLERYRPDDVPSLPPLVVLPARLLEDKGVLEFVQAARRLRAEGVEARFALVGAPDDENPASIAQARIDEWVREGVVEFWGWRNDMPEVLRQAQVVCLPSYREGLPKVLLEAAAAGRPVVASDVPGCRDAVRDGVTGLLVPVRDADALAHALRELLSDPAKSRCFGIEARRWAEEAFDERIAIARTLALYRELLVS